ncbi:MAG: PaaI family thioesterase [Acholeplasma sp.]|nr:PaaI family thioesterase [Acholeplasma sp.]
MKYKVLRKQFNSDECFICGVKNKSGLNAKFYELENKVVVAETKGYNDHQSYPNRMHGGIISALLDETIGRAISIDEPETWGVTIKLEITYRKPVPLDDKIIVCGWITKNKGQTFKGEGVVLDKDSKTVLAEATGTFFKQNIDNIIGDHFMPGWQYIEDHKPVLEIELDYEFTRG